MMEKDERQKNAALGCGDPRSSFTEDALINISPETLRLFTRHHGRLVLNIPKEAES